MNGDVTPDRRMVHVWAIRGILVHLGMWLLWVLLGLAAATTFAGLGLLLALVLATLLMTVAVVTSYGWAFLFWSFYRWRLEPEQIHIWRGILFRRRITIPYARIQNVNVVRSPLLLLFGISGVEIETAGQKGIYRGITSTEGFLPGVPEGERVADAIIERAKRPGATPGL